MKNKVKNVFDAYLVLSYRAGRKKALSILVRRWNKKLIRHIYYRTHDIEASKDIAQECWIAMMSGIFRLNDPAEFGVWALRIANNKAVDWIRKQARTRKLIEIKHNQKMILDESTLNDPRIEMIKDGYKRIPNKHRIMLNLYYRQGYSVKQMAKILEISEGTVKSRLFTARNELKKTIKK